MNTFSRMAVTGIAVSLLAAPAAFGGDSKNQGYVVDRDGNIITSGRTGDCVRSREWSPQRENNKCKPGAAQTAVRSPK